MNETKLILSDITKVLDALSNDDNKHELEILFAQLTQEIETQQNFVEGVTDFLIQTKQFDEAKEHTVIHTHNKQYEDIKADKVKIESRGMKAPFGYPCTFEMDCLFDDVKFELENQSN